MIVSTCYCIIAACMGWTAAHTVHLLLNHAHSMDQQGRNSAASQALMLGSLAMILVAQIFIPGSLVHEWLSIFCASLWVIVLTNLDSRLKRSMLRAS